MSGDDKLFQSLEKVIDTKDLDAFKGTKMSTAELLATLGSAQDTDRRRERFRAAGMNEDEISRRLMDEAQRQLADLKDGKIVPTRNHGNRANLREGD